MTVTGCRYFWQASALREIFYFDEKAEKLIKHRIEVIEPWGLQASRRSFLT